MRALVMDFRLDARAANIGDQSMFGPAILVNAVTDPATQSRRLYVPQVHMVRFLDRPTERRT